MGVCAGEAGTDTHIKAVHRGAVRPDEQRRQEVLAALSSSREQLFSCKGLIGRPAALRPTARRVGIRQKARPDANTLLLNEWL